MDVKKLSELLQPAYLEMINPIEGIKLNWWNNFNTLTGGLRMGELTILCAPTGAGKTAFISNIACQLVEQNIPSFVAPVETGDIDFAMRMFSVFDEKNLNNGDVISVEIADEVIKNHGLKMNNAPMFIATYDNYVPVDEMEAMLVYQIQNNGIRVALLDNLNFFLQASSAADSNVIIDEAVRVIGNIAKKYKIHIILICHPKKTENGMVKSEFDIKGSSSVVQEAANVLLFNRPEKNDYPNSYRIAQFKKMRKRGNIVNKQFVFSFKRGKYYEVETRDC